MPAYYAEITERSAGIVTVRLFFGDPASNVNVVADAIDAIARLTLTGGAGIKLTGPCSVPAAIAIGHAVSHLFGFVAYYDPKLSRFVVCVSHDPAVHPGDLIP